MTTTNNAPPTDPAQKKIYFNAMTQVNVGRIEIEQGNYASALQAFQQARQIFRSLDRKTDENRCLVEIASVYSDWRKYDKAQDIYKDVIKAFQQSNQPEYEHVAVGNLGNIYKDQGKYEKAIECYTRAIEFYKKSNNKRNQAVFLGNMAVINQQLGELDDAIDLYEQAQQLYEDYGDIRGKAIVLGNKGTVYQLQKKLALALQACQQALDIFQQLGDKKNTGIFMGNCGEVLLQMQEDEKGQALLERAIAICDETFPMGSGVFRGTLGLMKAKQGNQEKALELFAYAERDVVDYPLEHAKFLCKKARMQLLIKTTEDAKTSLERAETIAVEIGVQPESDLAHRIISLRTQQFAQQAEPFIAKLLHTGDG